MQSNQIAMIEILNLDYQIPVPHVFSQVQELSKPIWLDSGYPAANHGRFDILSAMPECHLQVSAPDTDSETERFFSQAEALLDGLEQPAASAAIPFQGGLMGYLGYGLTNQQPTPAYRQQLSLPEGYWGLYLWAIIYDHHSQTAQAVFHPQCSTDTKGRVIDLLNASKQAVDPKKEFQLSHPFRATESKTHYLDNIQRIKEYISAGDVYQVNYAQHFSATYLGPPAEAYLRQRQQHPAPYSAYIGLDQQAVLSHSPEAFIQIQGRDVQTQPIKGTAPRAECEQIDQRNADVLQSSLKDRAENLMIVDLLRNDLGKSCEPGSISVPKLFELQSFSNVHHLVSQVRGRLVKGIHNLTVLRRCHPGGSITGAPKIRAMQIINELETMPRSLYCGSIGFLSCCGQTHTNIAIRTMVADGEQIHCWGGGGIIADSVPEKEYQETLFKVGPMMESMEEQFLRESEAI